VDVECRNASRLLRRAAAGFLGPTDPVGGIRQPRSDPGAAPSEPFPRSAPGWEHGAAAPLRAGL